MRIALHFCTAQYSLFYFFITALVLSAYLDITPRETYRLMGFPDDYKIVVSKAQALKQSGNSIVVDVLVNILSQIIESYPSLITDI